MTSFALIVATAALLVAAPTSVSAYNNGRGRLPPMGWSTWCTDDACGAIDICTEKEVKSVADGIVAQGLDKLGYKYLLLDDCWSDKERNATGHLQPSAKHFPSGMRALADYVHSKGLYLGAYTCIGTHTCRRGRPGSYGHYKLDAETMADWGLDMVKTDNCNNLCYAAALARCAAAVVNRPLQQDSLGISHSSWLSLAAMALNATGHHMLFALCEWGDDDVLTWGGNVGQMWRVQMDHLPFWKFPAGGAGKGFGQGTADIIEYVGSIKPTQYVGPYNWMDPDFLETLFPITMDFIDSRTEYTFWTLWSAPLLVATDVRNLGPEKKSILANEEVIAIDQDPLGRAGDRIYNHTDGSQVWSKPLDSGDLAVVFYNSHHKQSLNISVTWDQLGLKSSKEMDVRDLWLKKDLGKFSGSFTATEVTPHDVLYVRMSPHKK